MEKHVPAAAAGCDWSELPADLLICILAELDVLDLSSVAGVCRSWRASYLEARRLGSSSGRNQGGPCLLYSSGDRDSATATLHRLSTGKLYHIPLPDPPLRSRFVVGSSHGWLATADKRSELHLVNPVTRAQIALPPPVIIKNVRGCYAAEGVLDGYALLDLDLGTRDCDPRADADDLSLEEARFFFYQRVAMSADPSSGSCVVVILHMPGNQLFFARVGMTRSGHGSTWLHAASTTTTSSTMTPASCSTPCEATTRYSSKYIVRAPWGAILQVWRWRDRKGEYRTVKLEVYEVDVAKQKLVEMKNLQDHVLFVGFNTPFFLSAKEFPVLTPNCVYLTNDNMSCIYSHRFAPPQVVVFNMEDGSFTDLLPDGSNSRFNWPVPIWIRPSCYHGN